MAAIQLFRKNKEQIEEIPAALTEGKGIILDIVWQAMWWNANVMPGVCKVDLIFRSVASLSQILLELSFRCMHPIKPEKKRKMFQFIF